MTTPKRPGTASGTTMASTSRMGVSSPGVGGGSEEFWPEQRRAQSDELGELVSFDLAAARPDPDAPAGGRGGTAAARPSAIPSHLRRGSLCNAPSSPRPNSNPGTGQNEAAGVISQHELDFRAEAFDLFKRIDADESGTLDLDEFEQLLQIGFGISKMDSLSISEELFNRLAKPNGEGETCISFKDYMFFMSNPDARLVQRQCLRVNFEQASLCGSSPDGRHLWLRDNTESVKCCGASHSLYS